MNVYKFDDQGNLHHFVNGELMAKVPESSISLYRESWPDIPDQSKKSEGEVVEIPAVDVT